MKRHNIDRFHPENKMFLYMPAPGDGSSNDGGGSGQSGGMGGGGGGTAGMGDSDSGGQGSGGAGSTGPNDGASGGGASSPNGPGDGAGDNSNYYGGQLDGPKAPAPTSSTSSSGGSSYSSAWADYMKKQWAQHLKYIKPIYNQLKNIMNTQWQWAKEDRERWETMFKPLEDALIADAKTFASQGKRELEAGRAASEVAKAFATQRASAQRNLEGYGIDPSQTRSQALDVRMRSAAAAAQAAAGNQARRYVDQVGRDLRGQAINLGNATAQRAQQETAGAISAGNTAGGLMNNAYNIGTGYVLGGGQLDYNYDALQQNADQFAENLAFQNEQFDFTQQQYYDQQARLNDSSISPGAVITSGGQALYDYYNNQPNTNTSVTGTPVVNPNNTYDPNRTDLGNNPPSNTWGNDFDGGDLSYQVAALGGVIADKKALLAPGIMQGPVNGAVPLTEPQPINPYGTAIPPKLPPRAPSFQGFQGGRSGTNIRPGQALPMYDGNGTVEGVGGPKDDMVPARLSPGEYVIPKEVVDWKGQEYFAKLLENSQKGALEQFQKNPPKFKQAIPMGGI